MLIMIKYGKKNLVHRKGAAPFFIYLYLLFSFSYNNKYNNTCCYKKYSGIVIPNINPKLEPDILPGIPLYSFGIAFGQRRGKLLCLAQIGIYHCLQLK